MAGHTTLLIISLIATVIFFGLSRWFSTKGNTWLRDFENKMNDRGFTERKVVYDILPNDHEKSLANEKSWTVGIWINRPKQLMALRLDGDATEVIDIPFNKIQSAEIIEDGYTRTTGGGVGVPVGPVVIAGGGAKSKEFSKGLQVRIVTGGINTRVQAYTLKLYDPKNMLNRRLLKYDPWYKAIQECARSIVDECENIMRHQGQY